MLFSGIRKGFFNKLKILQIKKIWKWKLKKLQLNKKKTLLKKKIPNKVINFPYPINKMTSKIAILKALLNHLILLKLLQILFKMKKLQIKRKMKNIKFIKIKFLQGKIQKLTFWVSKSTKMTIKNLLVKKTKTIILKEIKKKTAMKMSTCSLLKRS